MKKLKTFRIDATVHQALRDYLHARCFMGIGRAVELAILDAIKGDAILKWRTEAEDEYRRVMDKLI